MAGTATSPRTADALAAGALAALAAALRASADASEAAEAVVDHLAAAGPFMPSVYLERGGRLRCRAVRGYWQVLDGFPPEAGVIGRTFRTGRPQVVREPGTSPDFLEAVPGVHDEVCAPVRVGGAVVGVLNVESTEPLPDDAGALVAGAASLYGEHLERLGGPPRESAADRLARHAAGLAGLLDAEDLERRTVEAAVDVTGAASALLALRGAGDGGARHRRRAAGPLAEALCAVDEAGLATVSSWVAAGTSCYTLGAPGGLGFGGHEFFRRAGAGAVVVVPLQARGEVLGLLAVADRAPVPPCTEVVERLELLATAAAASLTTARALARLRDQAARDPLTGLGHAGAFRTDLAGRRSWLPPGRTAAVVLADVDHFKAVNDRHGHPEGDRLLVDLAGALGAGLRAGDRLYRIGGDEFAALLGVADADEALAVGQRLREAVAATGRATVSVGVAPVDGDEASDEAVARADAALYAAKAAGRDCARLAAAEAVAAVASSRARRRR